MRCPHGLWISACQRIPLVLALRLPAVGALLDRIPILFMSELDRSESTRHALIFPSAPYLRYPSPPSVLRGTVRQALSEK